MRVQAQYWSQLRLADVNMFMFGDDMWYCMARFFRVHQGESRRRRRIDAPNAIGYEGCIRIRLAGNAQLGFSRYDKSRFCSRRSRHLGMSPLYFPNQWAIGWRFHDRQHRLFDEISMSYPEVRQRFLAYLCWLSANRRWGRRRSCIRSPRWIIPTRRSAITGRTRRM